MGYTRVMLAGLAGAALLGGTRSAQAAPEGYASAQGIDVLETAGADQTDVTVKVVVDTTQLVADGKLRADAADVVFALGDAAACGGVTLAHWRDGDGTPGPTDFWVRVPLLLAGQTTKLVMYYGNPGDDDPSADAAAAAAVFDRTPSGSDVPAGTLGYSATGQVASGSAGGVSSSQRGFRFTPNKDVLLTSLGKREPTGTVRYVTLFNFTTQQKLMQEQVSGPAAEYSYLPVQPLWLRAGTEYVIEVYQGASDGYYFGTSSQISPDLTYGDMRYCNSCTQDTFPTNVLSNYHYGYADFGYVRSTQFTSQPIVTLAEATCDESATCNANCTAAACGDGVTNASAGEACDDGNADDTDACVACQAAACGDGVVYAGVEACDDGNADDTDACPTTCQDATCGDGFILAGVEACDDGNADDTDACLATCVEAVCGDGIVHAGVELCDDGNADDTDACLVTCTVASCGDGVVQAGVEACDDGNADDTDACLATCVVASCGDGAVQAGVEACDDGDADDTDACLSTCVAASCGDGAVQAGVEACDDGNADDTDACLATCVAASCGDGAVQAGIEECDDGNTADGDACSATCTVPTDCTDDDCGTDDVDDAGGCGCATGSRGAGDVGGLLALIAAAAWPLRRRRAQRR